MMQYSEDERKVINTIAKAIQEKRYSKTDEDYMFSLEWSEILADPVDQYDRLLHALEQLRKRNFDTHTVETTTLNGYIMRAKLSKTSKTVRLLISEELVTQLLASYNDDTSMPDSHGASLSISDLVERVSVG